MTMTACILHNICIRDPDADNDLMMEAWKVITVKPMLRKMPVQM